MFRSHWVRAIIVTTALAAAGCGATAENDHAAAASQAAARARGPVAAVEAAVSELGLRADQRAKTDVLFADAKRKLAPVAEARRAMLRELAAGVRAGRLDRATLDARTADISTAATAARPTLEASLNGLHAALDPDQRQDLVDALREGMHEGRGRRGGELRALAEELELGDEQKERIKDALQAEFMAKRAEHKAAFGDARDRMRAAAEAFESDRFDARALELGKNLPVMAERMSRGMSRALEVSLPHLDGSQRSKLAAALERKAAEVE
jgi:Spy/CpxP family protein refolding chaperone